MDDVLPGMIIDAVLGIDINVTDEFRGQLDEIVYYDRNEGRHPKTKEVL